MGSLKRRGSSGKGDESRDCESGSGSVSKDMQNFSMSSLISDLSKLVDGNNSSFLMHVDSNPTSRRSSFSPPDVQEPVLGSATPSSKGHGSDSCERLEDEVPGREEVPDKQGSQGDMDKQANFFLEDWMKGLSTAPLPIRRFPPPPLPAIFEQSGEESLCHSRASSVVSTASSMKSVKKYKVSSVGSSEIGKKTSTKSATKSMACEADAEHGRQIVEQDSWDDFDREMDKSLLPKECEIQEFEKLVEKNPNGSILHEEDKSMFGNAENILERDEKERGQFCQSANNTFSNQESIAAGEESYSAEGGILSITNYFKSRSSFPVECVANESSRFIDESVMISSPPKQQHPLNYSDEFKTTGNYSSLLFRDEDQNTLTPGTPTPTVESPSSLSVTANAKDDALSSNTPNIVKSFLLDNKTKKVANFLIGSDSNGAGRSTIMDYVLEVCKRRSSIGTSDVAINDYRSQLQTPVANKIPSSTLPEQDIQDYRDNNKSVKVHRTKLLYPPVYESKPEDEPRVGPSKKPLVPKLSDNQILCEAGKPKTPAAKKKPRPTLSEQDIQDYRDNNKSAKVHHTKLLYPPVYESKPEMPENEPKVGPSKKPLVSKLSDNQMLCQVGQPQEFKQLSAPISYPASQQTKKTRTYKKSHERLIQQDQQMDEKSFVVSEPGKVFHDDLDNTVDGFDKFKSNLHKPKTSQRVKLIDFASKENKQPTSAFATLPAYNGNSTVTLESSTSNRDSKIEGSIERLRTGGVLCLSPPERPYDATKSKTDSNERHGSQEGITPVKGLAVRLGSGANHSTPIAPEPVSKLLAKPIGTEESIMKKLQSQDSLVSIVSSTRTTETVRRKQDPSEHENATSTRNSSPVMHGKQEEVPLLHPTATSAKDETNKITCNDLKHKEQHCQQPRKTENLGLAASCQTSHLPDVHAGQQQRGTFSSMPSTYSYMGMMPPPGGCCFPQQFPVSIHIHLPSFPMGFPQHQYGTQSNGETFLPASASAATASTTDFNPPNPPCSNNCKCSHQPTTN